MLSRTKHLTVLIAFSSWMLSNSGFAAQKADIVILYTPNTKISVTPGQSVDYAIDLINNGNEVIDADISLNGLPLSWKYTLKAGAYSIRQLAVLPHERKSMNLSVMVPMKINKGSYRFKVTAGNLSQGSGGHIESSVPDLSQNLNALGMGGHIYNLFCPG
jgi:uncharacterized membrane protein